MMRVTCSVLSVVLCASAAVRADELLVNERTSSSQANPAVCATPDGGAVLVWSSYYTSSGRSNDIVARRLDPNGLLAGSEFRINAEVWGNQTEPAVAVDSVGNLIVAWQGPGLEEEDVFLRIVDPNGEPLTDELLINTSTAGRQRYPRVAASADGFVVAWESRVADADGDFVSIGAQRFDANGLLIGPEFCVDEDVYDCRYPDVAMDGVGNFAITWLQDRTSKTVFTRLYDPNGSPLTDPCAVSEASISSLTRPAIAMNAPGVFVIVWDGDPNRAGDDNVHARIYDPNGAPHHGPLIVNTLRDGAQRWPRVAIDDANEIIVVWEHGTGDPDMATEIYARGFAGDGQPTAAEFPLNSQPWGKQQYPAVAMLRTGSFVAAWESEEADGSGYDIVAQVVPAVPPADPNGDGDVTLLNVASLSRSPRCPFAEHPTRDGHTDARDLHLLSTQWLGGFTVHD